MADSDLIIKDGKFMRDGEIVPIEIGNAEQIALLKKYKKAREGDIDIDYSIDGNGKIEVEISLECIFCDSRVSKEKTVNVDISGGSVYNNDFDGAFDGDFFSCTKCGAKYTMGNDGILLV